MIFCQGGNGGRSSGSCAGHRGGEGCTGFGLEEHPRTHCAYTRRKFVPLIWRFNYVVHHTRNDAPSCRAEDADGKPKVLGPKLDKAPIPVGVSQAAHVEEVSARFDLLLTPENQGRHVTEAHVSRRVRWTPASSRNYNLCLEVPKLLNHIQLLESVELPGGAFRPCLEYNRYFIYFFCSIG